ncbi:MAG: hypothetical protein H6741_26055 [Alphaproteobacteria bacterium]|nr:hypothetical protein [Alphaproteobacteria bacterium]
MAGDAEAARESLRRALAHEEVALQASALLSQIDAQELRVRELPVEEDFTTSTGPWLHSWEHTGKGRVELRAPAGSPDNALAWSTEVSPREDDQIRIGFDLGEALPETIGLSVRAEAFPAYLMLLAYDAQGRSWTLPDFVVAPTDRWTTIEVALADFVSLPLETSTAAGSEGPDAITALALRDVTAYYSSDQGANVIFLDQVRIR